MCFLRNPEIIIFFFPPLFLHISQTFFIIIIIITITRFFISVWVQGQHPHQWAVFQVAGLLHTWQISHPRFPSPCMSQVVLTALLGHSTCPYQQSLLSFRMRSRSSMPSSTSSSLDLMVTMSCLTLQICLISALSFRRRRWRFVTVNGQVSLAWSMALCTRVYTWPCLFEREVAGRQSW